MSVTRPIKILHVLHSFTTGGLENGVVNLINHSDPDVFTHEVCCMTESGLAELRLTKDISIYEMHKQGGNNWEVIFRLARLMVGRRPHVVHTRNWGGIDGIIAARFAHVPAVIHGEHGWNMDDLDGKNIKRRVVRRLLSVAVNQYVAVSEDIRHWMIKSVGIRGSRISKIFNGVDSGRFCPADKDSARRAFGFPTGEFVVGTVGRLDPIKDQRLLIQAFAKLNHERGNLRLVIVGDGPERKPLEAIRNRLLCRDRIIFFGERQDIDKILSILDVFVLPSKNEGISNTILEAMASALPIIATAVGGNMELVQNGQNGFLVPRGDCEALTKALNSYIEGDGRMLKLHASNSRARAVQDFSLDRMVKQYEALYTSLVNGHDRA